MRYAVFPCLGLGDGLITLTLSYNLVRAGHQVDTYHPFMGQMQELFPKTPLLPRGEQPPELDQYDHLFIVYEKSPWMEELLEQSLNSYREKTTVLNPIASPLCDCPYWEEGEFDGTLPFTQNLVRFCHNKLGIEDAVGENGIVLPAGIESRKYPMRVAIHPTSSRAGKNWSKEKFLRLADRLTGEGFSPVFILTEEEQKEWPEVEAPVFEDLNALTYFIAESGYVIGNDSGIGHLGSCLGLPSLIICRSRMAADFWRPGWTPGEVIFPPKWIPNLKGMRWRDKKWQHFVPVQTVLEKFLELAKAGILSD